MVDSAAPEKNKGKVPPILLEFMRAPGGHSLVVKGDAGTGKTTLALQIIEEMGDEQPDYYLSTRVSDEALFRQFPWVREHKMRDNVLKAAKSFLQRTKENVPGEHVSPRVAAAAGKELLGVLNRTEGAQIVVRTELHKLEGQIEAGEITEDGEEGFLGDIGEEGITFDIGMLLPELEVAYDIAETNLPKKTLIVVDSIDALSERYGIQAQRLVNTLQKDLVENSHTNVIYTLERSGKTDMDYLGDGVIQMLSEDRGGRRVRQMAIEKLRGQKVERWKYYFTLDGGRMTVFEPTWVRVPETLQVMPKVPDADDQTISSGNESMDRHFGRIRRGSLVLWEFGLDVHQDVVRCLELAIMADVLRKGRGVAWLPMYATDYGLVERQMRMLTGMEKLPALRILDTQGDIAGQYESVKTVEGADIAQDLRWSEMKYMMDNANASEPYLSMLGYDAMEAIYGSGVFRSSLEHIDAMRRGGHVVIAIASSRSASLEALRQQAKMHIRFEDMGGCVMAAGMKPNTPYMYLNFEQPENRLPVPVLIPMI
jgi:KaiC/GvpD/RAD55 family RecA-like ATPase